MLLWNSPIIVYESVPWGTVMGFVILGKNKRMREGTDEETGALMFNE